MGRWSQCARGFRLLRQNMRYCSSLQWQRLEGDVETANDQPPFSKSPQPPTRLSFCTFPHLLPLRITLTLLPHSPPHPSPNTTPQHQNQHSIPNTLKLKKQKMRLSKTPLSSTSNSAVFLCPLILDTQHVYFWTVQWQRSFKSIFYTLLYPHVS